MSLITKHRPLTFDDVLGQDKIVADLKHKVIEKRAKTFLFTGPSGTGKTTLARILARGFAGENATAANIEEMPAADNTGVDDMRALIRRTHFRALGDSPVKAIILDEAHRLSGAAWDVLLKPTEEPPDHVYWFFCTTNVGKIPKTIQTRCLRYDLKPVSDDDLLELLVRVADAENITLEDDILESIADSSSGSPRQALSFLEACSQCVSSNEARAIMRAPGQTLEVIDLCRFLVAGRGSWPDAMKIMKGLENAEAESVRIQVVNYLGACLLGAKSNDSALKFLSLLSAFDTPYNQSDRIAPLMRSIGLALGLDR